MPRRGQEIGFGPQLPFSVYSLLHYMYSSMLGLRYECTLYKGPKESHFTMQKVSITELKMTGGKTTVQAEYRLHLKVALPH